MIRELKSGNIVSTRERLILKRTSVGTLVPFDLIEEAKKHEKDIQYFKHH